MAGNSTYYELVDRYLTGQLSPEETKEFEAQLSSDPELAKELEFQQKIGSVLKTGKALDLKARLNKIEADFQAAPPKAPQKQPRKQWGLWPRLAVAASFALLMTFLVRMWFFPPVDTLQLYADNFTPYPTKTVRKPGVALEKAVKSYEKKEYAEALPIFEQVAKTDSLYNEWSMYRGICYLETGNAVAAETDFLRLLAEGGAFYEEDARWYLVMAYLKQGQRQKAKTELNIFNAQKSTYKQDQVQQLLKNL